MPLTLSRQIGAYTFTATITLAEDDAGGAGDLQRQPEASPIETPTETPTETPAPARPVPSDDELLARVRAQWDSLRKITAEQSPTAARLLAHAEPHSVATFNGLTRVYLALPKPHFAALQMHRDAVSWAVRNVLDDVSLPVAAHFVLAGEAERGA